ncbi:uncharacterized protein ATNIH1004_007052 [Aspergillus tanneri]|uniref:FAD-binding PCMH-type domain-containing protein n=1 Tax=Aspergillus tanneri TaxID=1220188 RepID=A0A5M9MKX6_9EURO|nr:uncharacterized protein ATNIH1004_007052 [Aspergillus tanneri]KAA8645633.1 hypothetical protein ATNIH1004_007052 [Aspergillus tanneri]
MRTITFDDTKQQATVQFGQTLGPLALVLGQRGYALPHGTCSGVGISGHSLGGGWGFTSRKWGWLLDHVVSVEFVDITGSIRTLGPMSTGEDAELWWALRGAGSNNFGIVTSFTYALEVAPPTVVNYGMRFATNKDCVHVLLALQELGGLDANDDPNGFPPELGGQLIIMGRRVNDASVCQFTGQYLGSKYNYTTVIDRLLAKLSSRGVKPLEPEESYIREFHTWNLALTDLMGPLEASSVPLPYYAQSLLDNGRPNYTFDEADSIINALQTAIGIEGTSSHMSFDLNGPGSRTNLDPATGDMSFIHRRSLFLTQVYSVQFPGFENVTARAVALDKIRAVIDTMKQTSPDSDWHAYQNYIDPYLISFGRAYYGFNLDRLKLLKRALDPHTVLDFPQGLAHA